MKFNFLLGVFIFFLPIAKTFGCTCGGTSTINRAVKDADVVTVGTILTKSVEFLPDSSKYQEMIDMGWPEDQIDESLYGFSIIKLTLSIETILKGTITSDTLTILTGMGHGDCGFHFDVGKKYIVYGKHESYFGEFIHHISFPNERQIIWTNICTRTQEYNAEEIRRLKEIVK